MRSLSSRPSLNGSSPALHIGIIAPPWLPVPPMGYGGTENVLDVLARGLQEAGHEVTLFTTGDATCPVPRAWCFPDALGVGRGGAAHETRHVIEAYEALRGVDVVHDHTLVGPLYARSLPDLPVVTTNHGPFNEELSPVYRALAGRVPVIAISHHQASSAGSVPVAAVIHHGLALEAVTVGAGEGGYAAFLGRMHPDKGVDRAVRVARAAGIPLRIAAKMSEPAEREYFAARIKPLLGGDIEFLGEVGEHDKHALLGSASCLLNPIRWAEPFGMVMIEALACGTPVVSTRRGSAPEIVTDGETGFLRDNEHDLAEAVRRVGTLDRGRCRAEAERRFSSRTMVEQHVALYQRVASGSHRPRLLGASAGRGARQAHEGLEAAPLVEAALSAS